MIDGTNQTANDEQPSENMMRLMVGCMTAGTSTMTLVARLDKELVTQEEVFGAARQLVGYAAELASLIRAVAKSDEVAPDVSTEAWRLTAVSASLMVDSVNGLLAGLVSGGGLDA